MNFAICSGTDIIFYDREGKEKLKYNSCNSFQIETATIKNEFEDLEKRVFILFNSEVVNYNLLDIAYNNNQNILSDFEKETNEYQVINISETMNTEMFKMVAVGKIKTENGIDKKCKIVVDECRFASCDYLKRANLLTLSSEEVSQFDFAIECYKPEGSKDFVKVMLEK